MSNLREDIMQAILRVSVEPTCGHCGGEMLVKKQEHTPEREYSCPECELKFDEYGSQYEPWEMTDVEADADTLKSAGWGTDEDYRLPDEQL